MKLQNLLNQSDYDFYFLVVDKFLNIQLPRLKHFHPILATHEKNSGQLLANPKTIGYILSHSAARKVAIIPFKPSAKIEMICRQHHFILVANPTRLNRTLEDKLKFHQLCQTHNLPVLPATITTLTPKNFRPNQVIQTHFGWAGKSTYRFSSYSQAIKKIPPNTPIKISPYLQGFTLLNNCCLTRFGLIQSPPALQHTGLKPYTTNPFATVGRQWPCLAPASIQKKVRLITREFSQKILEPYHYRGFFGLDFLVSQNQVYLLECNPRLTASFAFYTYLELASRLTPLYYFHLAEFINLDYPLNIAAEQKRFFLPITGSELTPKDKNGKIIDQIRSI